MMAFEAAGTIEIFSDGLPSGGGLGSLHVAMATQPNELPVSSIRVSMTSPVGGAGAEILSSDVARVRAEIRSGALSVRVACDVVQFRERASSPGVITARLSESMSRDVVHLEIARAGVPLARMEVARAALDATIAFLAVLDGHDAPGVESRPQ